MDQNVDEHARKLDTKGPRHPRIRRFLVGLLVVSTFIFSLAPAAMAAQREREEMYDSRVDVPHACLELTPTYTIEGHVTTLFSSSGEPVQLVLHINFKAATTNTASGNTYSNCAYETIVIDLQTGDLTINGLGGSRDLNDIGPGNTW